MIEAFFWQSLLFAFIYWWFIDEGRYERVFYLIGYGVVGLATAFVLTPAEGVLALSTMMVVMITHWYIGFKFDVGTIDG